MTWGIYSMFIPCHSATHELTLHDALNVHVYNTRYVKAKRLALANALMECENFRKSMLPALSLNLAPVSFDHSMRLLQNYITGEYSNVEEYSNTVAGGISVTQKISATGGSLTLGSTLSYLHEFASGNNSFSTAPMYMSYTQPLLGGGKSSKLEKAMYKLKNEIAVKDFCSSVSSEQQKILSLYLDTYFCKMDIDFYAKAVSMGDSLLMHAAIRKKAGKITEYEYSQVELQQLDSQIALEEARSSYASSMRLLENELALHEITLGDISVAGFPAFIDDKLVMELVRTNSPEYQSMEMELLNAEYSMHQAMLSSRFNGNVSLSCGLNQYAKTFKHAYTRPDMRQALSVTLSVPVFQWGINRNKKKMARNEYETVLIEQEQALDDFKSEIFDSVSDYNISKRLADAAVKKYELSARQYSFAAMRFGAGKISASELSASHAEHLKAKQSYMSVLKTSLVQYYKIRHLSLYDFIEGKSLAEIIPVEDMTCGAK